MVPLSNRLCRELDTDAFNVPADNEYVISTRVQDHALELIALTGEQNNLAIRGINCREWRLTDARCSSPRL